MKSLRLKFMLTLAYTMLFGAGFAHAADNDFNCANPTFQQEMNYCAYQAYQAADEDLNLAYGLARHAMQETDGYLPENMVGAADSLLYAQRAWIKYRDLACETEGFLFRGGTMEPLIVSTCKERLTRLRTEDLRSMSEVN